MTGNELANALGDVRLYQKLMPPSVIPFRLLVVPARTI